MRRGREGGAQERAQIAAHGAPETQTAHAAASPLPSAVPGASPAPAPALPLASEERSNAVDAARVPRGASEVR